MIPTPTRPLTSKLSETVVATILCYSPAHAADHLVHAWTAYEVEVREFEAALAG